MLKGIVALIPVSPLSGNNIKCVGSLHACMSPHIDGKVIVMQIMLLAAAKRTHWCDATVTTTTTNHYVAFPVSALRAAHVPRPLPCTSISLSSSPRSILLSESQTAAAQGTESENTVIVSDKNRGA